MLIYLLVVNALGFAVMLYDKYLAKNNLWRIPETTLMGIAIIGGSVGSLFGMYSVRHKTRHLKFTLGIPAILILQVALTIYILYIK